MQYRKLPRSFCRRPTRTVARSLIGKLLVRRLGAKELIVRIVETEAYLGSEDPASHAYRGRTARNDVMFREGGALYVYFTYGMHYCANVVTEGEGKGCAVLLRAAEPLGGIGTMARHRGVPPAEARRLCSGPAKLCQALGLGRRENGADLAGEEIFLAADADSARKRPIGRSGRIGIRHASERLDRYFERNNPFLSGPRGT
jgi:DNA-3-methyladenine glycosylase